MITSPGVNGGQAMANVRNTTIAVIIMAMLLILATGTANAATKKRQ